ncbi:MAG TPA: LPS assembly lipoprotein LptE, partial [Sphingomonadales bacterium]|nr:LPS assembly lipoprotein LptE [Sphingomonadales bacterium]
MKAILTAAFLALTLSACGFTPMYATSGAGEGLAADFAAVKVAPIPERIGQMVWNHLLDRLNPEGEPGAADYELHVALTEKTLGYGFRSDAAVTRESYTLEGAFQLLDRKTGAAVFEGTQRSAISYDIVQSDFANASARQDAKARTAEELANLITLRLGLYFKAE